MLFGKRQDLTLGVGVTLGVGAMCGCVTLGVLDPRCARCAENQAAALMTVTWKKNLGTVMGAWHSKM